MPDPTNLDLKYTTKGKKTLNKPAPDSSSVKTLASVPPELKYGTISCRVAASLDPI